MSDSSTSGPGDERADSDQPAPPYGQQYGQGYGQSAGYQPYGYEHGYQGQRPGYYGVPPNHPQSTMALTLGLVGLIGTMLCLLPAVVGPFAWYIGAKAKKEIDASGGQLGGRGQAVAGYVLGIITSVLLVLVVLAVGALIAIGIAGGLADPSTPTY